MTAKVDPGPKDGRVELRLSNEMLRSLDDWRREQDDLPSRSEAIRRLVQQSLAKPKRR